MSPPLAADIPSSRIVNKKKKISKKGKKSKKGEQSIVYTKEDFIVRIPSDLWDKEVQNINCNISTNGLNSTEQEQLKLWAPQIDWYLLLLFIFNTSLLYFSNPIFCYLFFFACKKIYITKYYEIWINSKCYYLLGCIKVMILLRIRNCKK